MDFTDIVLRLVGAFYAFAGYAATRAGLTSLFVDRAISAIEMKRPPAAETAQTIWLLSAAGLIFAGGVLLVFAIDLAVWLFAASSLGQAAYIYHVAPRYFDPVNAPDEQGRRQSTNAFVLYAAATAFVTWAAYTGRLASVRDTPWPILAIACAAVAAQVAYVSWTAARTPPR